MISHSRLMKPPKVKPDSDKDYCYADEDIHGILISKSITIDGAGHTLDAKNHPEFSISQQTMWF